MKTFLNYMTIMALLLTFSSCEEEEVMTFDSERGVNFVIYSSAYGTYTDDYENLKSEHNFVKDYGSVQEVTMTLPDYLVEVGVQLEGEFSDKPVKVKVKAEAVEGYDLAQVELPEEVVIEPGEYRAHFTVVCKQPAEYNKEYKVKLVFDYANSDVIAGTKERQEYVITVSDELIWKDMYVSDLANWNAIWSQYLGEGGDVKLRFIYVGLKQGGYNYNTTNSGAYYYGSMGRPTVGFREKYELTYLRNALAEYNASHDSPLAELDGTLVTFP